SAGVAVSGGGSARTRRFCVVLCCGGEIQWSGLVGGVLAAVLPLLVASSGQGVFSGGGFGSAVMVW
ncbi:hypothetical protein A2U01_0066433, partial [Trifolium medium]|nr:hypothetical protein [Trifolium medium]